MSGLNFSIIIPVYNRPEEIEKLLASLVCQDFNDEFEVVIIEDGSSISSESICSRFRESLNINYFFKPNSGPGDSRNYGMSKASGNYFIILDSDCILPPFYLSIILKHLNDTFVDCFGGPDAAHDSFSTLQKAINYSMTSFFTTGGIRGSNEVLGKFQPRSFNLGISKRAFEATGGFGKIHPGEDPDLSIRLWKLGFQTRLIKDAYVFHERRISWRLFFNQVNKFGKVRVILNKWHPHTKKLTYWFPTIFMLGLIISFLLFLLDFPWLLYCYFLYFVIIGLHSTIMNGWRVGIASIIAVITQFTGYGLGYITSWWNIFLLGKNEVKTYPRLFFK